MTEGPTPHGIRGVLLGAFIAAFSLFPMSAALFDPTEEAMPSGRLPAFLAGSVFLFAGYGIVLTALGFSASSAVAALASLFLGVPLAIAAQGARGLDAAPGSLASLAAGTTGLAVVAGYLWNIVLRDRARTRQEGRSPWRFALGSLVGLGFLTPFLAMMTPLAAAAAVALPVMVAAAAVEGRTGGGARRTKLASMALSLSAMPLVVAPARALAGLLARAGGMRYDEIVGALVRSDPLVHASLDALAGVGGLMSLAALAAARRWVPESLRERAVLLPDRAHGVATLLLSAGLALAAAVDLRPEMFPWRRADLAGVERTLPPEAQRALARIAGDDPAWRARALSDVADADVSLEAAIPYLIGLLGHRDEGVRTSAATLLRLRARPGPEHRDGLPLFRSLVSSREPELRRLALNVLPAMAEGDGATLAAVLASAASADTYTHVRGEALAAVAAEGEAARPALMEALEKLPALRGAVIGTLESLSPAPSARLELHRGLLASDDPAVRAWAVPGFAALAPEHPEAAAELVALVRGNAELQDAALDAICSASPAALDDLDDATLARFLGSRMYATRLAVRERLDARGAPAEVLVPALVGALERGDEYARQEAMRQLITLGAPPEAVPLAARAIAEHDGQNLRVAAAALLATMGADAAPAVPSLLSIVAGGDTYAAGHAADALAAIGPAASAAAPELKRILDGGSPLASRVLPAYAVVSAPPRRLLDPSAPPLFAVDGPVQELAWKPLDVGAYFTIELSVRLPEGAAAGGTLLDTGFLVVSLDPARRLGLSYRLGSGALVGTTPETAYLLPGPWYHVAVSHDRAAPCALTIHLNGDERGVLPAYDWVEGTGLRVLPERIDRLVLGSPGLRAEFADVRVFDAALPRP